MEKPGEARSRARPVVASSAKLEGGGRAGGGPEIRVCAFASRQQLLFLALARARPLLPPSRSSADSRLGKLPLDALPLVSAVGFATDVSQHLAPCGTTWRAGDRGATKDMLVQNQRRKCGARERARVRAAKREDVERPGWVTISGTTQLIRAALDKDVPCVRQLRNAAGRQVRG